MSFNLFCLCTTMKSAQKRARLLQRSCADNFDKHFRPEFEQTWFVFVFMEILINKYEHGIITAKSQQKTRTTIAASQRIARLLQRRCSYYRVQFKQHWRRALSSWQSATWRHGNFTHTQTWQVIFMIVFTLNNQSANRPDYKNYIITRTIFNRSDAAAAEAVTQQHKLHWKTLSERIF